MMRRRLLLLLLSGAALFAPSLAVAAGPLPELLGGFKNWAAYSTGTGDAKVCYALSRPVSSEPKKARRDPIYFLINDWPGRKAKAEPEIMPGYQYKDGSDVTVDVGSAKFTFFTKNEEGAGGAWVEAQADEERLVEAMKTAPEAVVTGTSKRGTVTHDTYSLAGLPDALDKAHAACAM
jgi:hypothetical protein